MLIRVRFTTYVNKGGSKYAFMWKKFWLYKGSGDHSSRIHFSNEQKVSR